MYKQKLVFILFILLSTSFSTVNKTTDNNLIPNKFKWDVTLEKGEYIYNDLELYFFDPGMNCILYDKCPDLDTVFENSSKKIVIEENTTLKYQAYLFTDNYEYLFVLLNKEKVWIRTEIPIPDKTKIFLKEFLNEGSKPMHSHYVEIIPFKESNNAFISATNDWFIVNLKKQKTKKIGTKKNSFEVCRMVYKKNCVECYINLGWGETIWFDENGKKKK